MDSTGLSVTPRDTHFTYTNWRGEAGHRRVKPLMVWYGESEYHAGAQWFLRGTDLDKNETRDFAMQDMRDVWYATDAPVALEPESCSYYEGMSLHRLHDGQTTVWQEHVRLSGPFDSFAAARTWIDGYLSPHITGKLHLSPN